jgi:hypothetical protein
MNIFEEILWPQFIQYEHIKRLSLNEQVNQYNQYLWELSIARQNWLNYQNKGDVILQIQVVGFLAQEDSFINSFDQVDYFNILQEDGSYIGVTALAP